MKYLHHFINQLLVSLRRLPNPRLHSFHCLEHTNKQCQVHREKVSYEPEKHIVAIQFAQTEINRNKQQQGIEKNKCDKVKFQIKRQRQAHCIP